MISVVLAQASSPASAATPLFSNQWLALLAVLACVAAFMVLIAAVGRWLAATHPAPLPEPAPEPVVIDQAPPEIVAVIAGAVTAALGASARIASVRPIAPASAPSVEMLMQQWSLEGRRQIYSSHHFR